MIVKLLTEYHLEFLSLKVAAEAGPSLHLSKCQIVGNLSTGVKLCKTHYLTYLYLINFNRLVNSVSSLKIKALNADKGHTL